MPKITFVTQDGDKILADIPVGVSLMHGAVDAGIDDILAECGGVASCGTCKIILDDENSAKLPAASAIEGSMLEDDPPGWRLSCQVVVDPEMEGLVVRVAPTEY